MAGLEPFETPGAKMQYLIKRRPSTSREELIAHWFANHMSGVIAWNESYVEESKRAIRYVASLFDQEDPAAHGWDGVGQLWYNAPLRIQSKPAASSRIIRFSSE